MRHVAWVLGLISLGCNIVGSSPHASFYALDARGGQVSEEPVLRVELRRPGLPDYLDRPQIVRRVDDGRLELSETERWGASLTEMISTTLARNLSRRLPRSDVFTEAGGVSAAPDVSIEVELQQFELTAEGTVKLSAQVALHWKSGGGEAVLERVELQKQPASQTTAAVVDAMSALLAELAEGIAALIVRG